MAIVDQLGPPDVTRADIANADAGQHPCAVYSQLEQLARLAHRAACVLRHSACVSETV